MSLHLLLSRLYSGFQQKIEKSYWYSRYIFLSVRRYFDLTFLGFLDDLESLELDEVSKESHPAKNLVEFLLVGAEKKSSRGSDAACELSAVVRFLKSIYQILLDLG